MVGLANLHRKTHNEKRITTYIRTKEKDVFYTHRKESTREERRRTRGEKERMEVRARTDTEEKRDTEGWMRKRNPAVGQADKLLRNFSLALLSSIDVDSTLPRRKAPAKLCGALHASYVLRTHRGAPLYNARRHFPRRAIWNAVPSSSSPATRTILRFHGFANTSDSRISRDFYRGATMRAWSKAQRQRRILFSDKHFPGAPLRS